MIPRPARILAITRRELLQDLKGRRWISVPALLVALLLPASVLPSTNPFDSPTIWVTGDVPDDVLDVEHVRSGRNYVSLRFAEQDGRLDLTGPDLAPSVREALDASHPKGRVTIERRRPVAQMPRRGLFLALLAASGLTASIAASIGTERSRRTLGTLLSAAISPLEIVLGKLVAWGGIATISTLLFAGVALLRGVLEPGWWLLPMALTPGTTVAIGLWSVRSAPDVVSATTTALREMPLITMVTAIAAVVLGDTEPVLGAMVPLGGAICTAGEMWTEHPARDALVASLSSVLVTGAFVAHTAASLTEKPKGSPPGEGWSAVPLPLALMSATTFCAFVAPALWRVAGNPTVTAEVTADQMAWTAAACMAVALIGLGLRHHGGAPFMHLGRPKGVSLAVGVLGGALLAAATPLFGMAADGGSMLGVVAAQYHAGLLPMATPLAALACITGEELLFRGVLAPRMGHGPAAAAWALAKAPLDPLAALSAGTAMGVLGARWGVVASWTARVTWWAAVTYGM